MLPSNYVAQNAWYEATGVEKPCSKALAFTPYLQAYCICIIFDLEILNFTPHARLVEVDSALEQDA